MELGLEVVRPLRDLFSQIIQLFAFELGNEIAKSGEK
jgi:hypothetical protein